MPMFYFKKIHLQVVIIHFAIWTTLTPCRVLSSQIIIFHQPGFSWNKGISFLSYLFGVRSCEVAIIWPDFYLFQMVGAKSWEWQVTSCLGSIERSRPRLKMNPTPLITKKPEPFQLPTMGGTYGLPMVTLPETNIAPVRRPSQKETYLPTMDFQGLC